MLILIIVLTILIVFYWYIGWSITRAFTGRTKLKISIWSLLLFFLIITPITQFLNFNNYQGVLTTTLNWIVFTAFGFFSLLFIFFLFRDIGFISTESVINTVKFLSAKFTKKNSPEVPDPSKRKFLLNSFNLGIVGISGVMTAYGVYGSRFNHQIKRIQIPFNNLPDSLQDFKIVQITDLHIGLTITKDFIEEIVDKVNSLKADMIVFTGDFADGSVEQLEKDVEPLSKLSAPLGKYFVTGNHEYYSGLEQWLKKIQKLGFTTLINENRIINKNSGKIMLAGVTDYNGGRFSSSHASDPFKAKSGAKEQYDISILLAHQPRSIYTAAMAGFDLQLSGHTHGGQYFPWNFFVRLQQPYISGLHQYKNTKVYVSRGTGYWGPPLRVGAPSEITIIQLTKTGNLNNEYSG